MHYQQPSKLQAVVLDWAGTVVDFGSFAPTQIFVEAFGEFGVAVSLEEARGPMCMGKWDHIRT
ncbi:MAG: phosphonoacetaldehyde hydrolase, partial [Pseudomonas sp.]